MILEEKVGGIQGVTMTPSLALKMADMAHDKGCRQPWGAESGPGLAAGKERGPSSHSCKESWHCWQELGSRSCCTSWEVDCFLHSPDKSPAWPVCRFQLWVENPLSPQGLLICDCEIHCGCCLKSPRLWESVTKEGKLIKSVSHHDAADFPSAGCF